MLKRTSLALLLAVVGCGDNAPTNFPPVLTAQAIELTMVEDGTSTIDATATDPEAEAVTYAATAPSHGVLTGSGPTYTYKPAAGYVGDDALTITVSDGDNALAVPVRIAILAADRAPVADPQAVSVDRNVARAITLTGHDADASATLIFEVATPPAHGTLSGDPPELTYTPDHGYAGPDAFTFNATDSRLTSADATVSITVVPVVVCGDGLPEGAEACDDGNGVNDDGCSNLCLAPACGDGIVQLDRGEECDDGNQLAGDGCDAACLSGGFATVAPVVISGSDPCTTAKAGLSHKVAVDGSGTIYAIMKCGGEAEAASVVVSRDRGLTYSAPLRLAAAGEFDQHVAIAAAGPTGVAYAAWIDDDDDVWLSRTLDAGLTWSPPAVVGRTSDGGSGLSLQAFNDHVFVGFQTSGGLAVVTSAQRASAPFATTTATMGISPIDLLFDPVSHLLYVTGDSPTFSVRVSADAGATFSPEANPPGSQFWSDWAVGAGRVFVAGSNLGPGGNANALYVITSASASAKITGLPATTGEYVRALAADSHGDAFVGSQLDAGAIQLDRLALDATAFDVARAISPSGDSPSVAALPGQHGAVVIYSDSFSVWASVQSYDPPP
jgi:cysteine-rich repeat protein